MKWVLIGAAGFLFFLLYDFLNMRRVKWSVITFIAGGALLLASTALYSLGSIIESLKARPLFCLIALACAAASLFLLIYVLFFALPAGSTYIKGGKRPVITSGWYGLCRHPGVWWLSSFYLFIFIAALSHAALAAWLLYTALDIVYVIIQEKLIFPHILEGYETYKKDVPFLLPHLKNRKK